MTSKCLAETGNSMESIGGLGKKIRQQQRIKRGSANRVPKKNPVRIQDRGPQTGELVQGCDSPCFKPETVVCNVPIPELSTLKLPSDRSNNLFCRGEEAGYVMVLEPCGLF